MSQSIESLGHVVVVSWALSFGRFLSQRNGAKLSIGTSSCFVKEQIRVKVHTDTNFAGCSSTRKSTSDSVIKLGLHCVKTWSTTQSVIAFSSGGVEYYGLIKGAAEALGVKAMFDDLGLRQIFV